MVIYGEKGGAFFNGKEDFCPPELGEPKGSQRLLKVGFRKFYYVPNPM